MFLWAVGMRKGDCTIMNIFNMSVKRYINPQKNHLKAYFILPEKILSLFLIIEKEILGYLFSF